jgi:predicted NUDIX family phosphoesterase
MVIDRDILFKERYFQGFSLADDARYYDLIHDHYVYKNRDDVEANPQLKQPIGYCIIVNQDTQKIFAYQRSSKAGHYNETRLRGKWSWGIGGHIDRIDQAGRDPILDSMMREIDEEVKISDKSQPEILGYINDDESDVGKVHFGILFLIRTRSSEVLPNDKEIAWGGFKTLAELEQIVASPDENVETWSEISLGPLRRVLL